jgi:hypothetical protein
MAAGVPARLFPEPRSSLETSTSASTTWTLVEPYSAAIWIMLAPGVPFLQVRTGLPLESPAFEGSSFRMGVVTPSLEAA